MIFYPQFSPSPLVLDAAIPHDGDCTKTCLGDFSLGTDVHVFHYEATQ